MDRCYRERGLENRPVDHAGGSGSLSRNESGVGTGRACSGNSLLAVSLFEQNRDRDATGVHHRLFHTAAAILYIPTQNVVSISVQHRTYAYKRNRSLASG